MAKGYYRFHNGIYPRRLYIAVGADEDYVNGVFCQREGKISVDWDGYDAVEFDEGKEISTGCIGSLVIFHGKRDMTPKIMAHEAVHVIETFMDTLGLERVENGNNEHLSYLMGWIVGCMDDVRAGKAEIVKTDKTKRKEKK